MNLLEETEKKLSQFGKTWSDVNWIGGDDFTISINEFRELANKEYDNGFGGQEVARDLIIAGSDWWFERGEYDGSEWWDFKTLPKKPTEQKSVKSLFAKCGWETLSEINSENKE